MRRYEADGFIPAASRTASGHRRYDRRHVDALRTARTLRFGYGWQRALDAMRAVHRGDVVTALALADARHALLDRRRSEIREAIRALRVVAESRPGRSDRQPVRIGGAARRLGVPVSTIRFWEHERLLEPPREPISRYRLYDGEQLRRLQLVALLRNAGYTVEAIRAVLDELAAGRPKRALQAMHKRRDEIASLSYACARATAALAAYVEEWHAAEARPLEGLPERADYETVRPSRSRRRTDRR